MAAENKLNVESRSSPSRFRHQVQGLPQDSCRSRLNRKQLRVEGSFPASAWLGVAKLSLTFTVMSVLPISWRGVRNKIRPVVKTILICFQEGHQMVAGGRVAGEWESQNWFVFRRGRGWE